MRDSILFSYSECSRGSKGARGVARMWDNDAGRSLTMVQEPDLPASLGDTAGAPKTAASFYRSSRPVIAVGPPSSLYSAAGAQINSIRSNFTTADSHHNFREKASAVGIPKYVSQMTAPPSSTHSASLPDLRLQWEAAGRLPDMVCPPVACSHDPML